jgi:hypothetical protein
MTETMLDGLTHTCADPDCHIPGFVVTLQRLAGSQRDAALYAFGLELGKAHRALVAMDAALGDCVCREFYSCTPCRARAAATAATAATLDHVESAE